MMSDQERETLAYIQGGLTIVIGTAFLISGIIGLVEDGPWWSVTVCWCAAFASGLMVLHIFGKANQ